eukprot:gene34323-41539_t
MYCLECGLCIPWLSKLSFFRKSSKQESQLAEANQLLLLQAKIDSLLSDIERLQYQLKKSRCESQANRRTRIQHAETLKRLEEQFAVKLALKDSEHRDAMESMISEIKEELSSQFKQEKAALISEMERKHEEEIEAFRRHIHSLETKEENYKEKLERLKEELGLARQASKKTEEEFHAKTEASSKTIKDLEKKLNDAGVRENALAEKLKKTSSASIATPQKVTKGRASSSNSRIGSRRVVNQASHSRAHTHSPKTR